MAKSPPDGYTLLVYGSSTWIVPFLQDGITYDPVRDFAPVTMVVRSPNILVVHPSLPVKTVKELIALAKSMPGTLNYAAAGEGSSPWLAG